MNVQFICRGNSLRSVIAEAYLKSKQLQDVKVFSSGTVADEYRDKNQPIRDSTYELLSRHGLSEYHKSEPDQLNQEKLDSADINIFMNEIALIEAKQSYQIPKNTQIFHIIDVGEAPRLLKEGEAHNKYDEEMFLEITDSVDELINTKLNKN